MGKPFQSLPLEMSLSRLVVLTTVMLCFQFDWFWGSFTAMHWLSKGKQYMHAARCPESPEKSKRFWDSGRVSIQARSKGIVPGGRFVCVNFLCIQRGYFHANRCRASMWDSFQTAGIVLKTEQKMIDEDERLGILPNYYRTRILSVLTIFRPL
jgi:hypothetical protein